MESHLSKANNAKRHFYVSTLKIASHYDLPYVLATSLWKLLVLPENPYEGPASSMILKVRVKLNIPGEPRGVSGSWLVLTAFSSQAQAEQSFAKNKSPKIIDTQIALLKEEGKVEKVKREEEEADWLWANPETDCRTSKLGNFFEVAHKCSIYA